MNEADHINEADDPRLASYLYLRDHGVNTWEEFREFNEKFPDASDAVVWSLIMRIFKEKHGVSLFGC
jgi:hypothetical protein